jgi:peptidase S41-like protein
MLRRFFAVAFLILAVALAQPASAQVAIPATPAGGALQAWLAAFNSGDKAQMEAYTRKYDPKGSADRMMAFHNQTGGFELLQILKSERLHIEFLVKEHGSPTRALGNFDVKDADPPEVTEFGLQALPPDANVSDLTFAIDAATRARVIDGAIKNLNEFYVFPDVAKKMEDSVRAKQKHGDYDSIADGNALASRLTDDFQAISHDKHLHVNYSAVKMPERHADAKPSPEEVARYTKDMQRMNCGFDKVEHLEGNVGYLKFNFFADPDICGPTAVAAMNFLANVDAIIFDLRENGGGDPKMVAFIQSYLFDEPTHLNDLWERKGDVTHQYWTLPYVPGKLLAGKPVYVLTSHETFSGGEEFCYNLKNLKRATLIGEATGGGAHPVNGHRIDDHFVIGVPFARAINPISKTNWEGTGVEPDVKVAAADALTTAEKLAHEKLNPK